MTLKSVLVDLGHWFCSITWTVTSTRIKLKFEIKCISVGGRKILGQVFISTGQCIPWPVPHKGPLFEWAGWAEDHFMAAEDEHFWIYVGLKDSGHFEAQYNYSGWLESDACPGPLKPNSFVCTVWNWRSNCGKADEGLSLKIRFKSQLRHDDFLSRSTYPTPQVSCEVKTLLCPLWKNGRI